MFRKTILTIAATAALGAAALAPTAASAGYYGHHHHHHNHYKSFSYKSHYVPAYKSYASSCSWQKRYVETYYGTEVKWVKVCW